MQVIEMMFVSMMITHDLILRVRSTCGGATSVLKQPYDSAG
jgi:hypothetical protein